MSEITSDLARCVGLWMAEGDTKTDREITFTNNCKKLIDFFKETLISLFDKEENPRVYIYYHRKNAKNTGKFSFNCKTREYLDERATKPYFIYKLYSTKLHRKWENLVEVAKSNQKWYKFLLQGFFAGEGNIKEGSHNHRSVRIAQGKKNTFLEKMLDHFNISHNFSGKRAYVIQGRKNLERLEEIDIAKLHPIKKRDFRRMVKGYKERHYSKGELKGKVYSVLIDAFTSMELSKKFERSQARLQRVLTELKKSGKVQNYRVRSKDYWIRNDQNTIIISKVKKKYLDKLDKFDRTFEFENEFDVCWKASNKILSGLQRLGLVKRNQNKIWEKVDTGKKVITK